MKINLSRRRLWTSLMLGVNSIFCAWNITFFISSGEKLNLFLAGFNFFVCLMCFYGFHQLTQIENIRKAIEELERIIAEREANGKS